jgi:V8-like Glu-specific endopeptidase
VAPVVCIHSETAPAPTSDGTAIFISKTGEFVTPAHVLDDFAKGHPLADCARAAVEVPIGGWHPGPVNFQWYAFDVDKCEVDAAGDIAHCATLEDLTSAAEGKFAPKAVTFDSDWKDEGTFVAFTGFPAYTVTPITSRGSIAAYVPIENGVTRQLIDKAAWPGSSGSPVYDESGRVLGMIVGAGVGRESGVASAVPSDAIISFLRDHPLRAATASK